MDTNENQLGDLVFGGTPEPVESAPQEEAEAVEEAKVTAPSEDADDVGDEEPEGDAGDDASQKTDRDRVKAERAKSRRLTKAVKGLSSKNDALEESLAKTQQTIADQEAAIEDLNARLRDLDAEKVDEFDDAGKAVQQLERREIARGLKKAEASRDKATEAAKETARKRIDAVVEAGEERFSDFGKAQRRLGTSLKGIDAGRELLEQIIDADEPEALIHHLGMNPDALEDVLSAPKRRWGIEIGKLSVALEAASDDAGEADPVHKSAPEPTPRLKSGRASDKGSMDLGEMADLLRQGKQVF